MYSTKVRLEMKTSKLPFSLKQPLKSSINRQNIERLSIILIGICCLSVFLGRLESKQAIQLDNGKLQYTGYVVANKMNGQGTLTFENGDVYEGEFTDGIFNGQGTFKSASGWMYVGEFKNGYADGKGKLTTEGQATYEGIFKQGIYQHAN